MENLQKQIKVLKIYVGLLTVVVICFMGVMIKQMYGSQQGKTLTAERIDIVDPNGKIRMTISNRESQNPGVVAGKQLPKRARPAGMIFFNDEGDECGGLIYDGDKKSASMTYSIDQYHNDQIMQLQYAQETNGNKQERSYGLKMWDRYDNFPSSRIMGYVDSLTQLHDSSAYKAGIVKLNASGVVTKERLFLGKNTTGEVGLFIKDEKGVPRLRICVDTNNKPLIQVLDDKGSFINSK